MWCQPVTLEVTPVFESRSQRKGLTLNVGRGPSRPGTDPRDRTFSRHQVLKREGEDPVNPLETKNQSLGRGYFN